MELEKTIIHGLPPSKSNGYKVITIGGHASLGKTRVMREYENGFFMQCPYRGLRINQRFLLEVDVYFKSDRPDLDNALKIILDCLQGCKVITNDRFCAEIHARKLIDKERPRIEFSIKTLTE